MFYTNSDAPYEVSPTPLLTCVSPEKGLTPLKAKYGTVRHILKATVTLEKHLSDKISFTLGTYFSVF